ncbi:hypothetical protein ATE49_13890 [Elizabethkingia miricola]|uniref:Glycosyltransferase involved in cell wall biosynthesis n=1 Tax=Elizabethkingia miricola TaxID=172045 RepID=A0ABY3NEW5_ELIMR|nr:MULTISPECIES: glycosyltransferase family 2 protein [Elizabethkingia]OBS13152.1 hypothetical protein ATE49_13890 [Elizabethkingia miricola]TYO89747.1 glycosyltransferase involved in cell wall biosynthesis [Elizabethkingia miricola]
MKDLISIIIPIYKVEKYIRKCVQSVLQQNYTSIELILVDDGSPDNCPEICDELALTDSRIKVIHKENGGLSDARNIGIKAASGEYIMFLDSDDYWEGKDFLNNLISRVQLALQPDIILYGTYDVSENNGSKRKSRGDYNTNEIRKSRDNAIKSLFETGEFPGSAWVVAINKEFLLKNNLFFIKGIKSEDIDWLINVFFHAEKIDCITDAFYMYLRGREGSIVNSSNAKSIDDILVSVDKWKPVLKSNLSAYNKYLLSYLSYQYITTYIIYSKLEKADQQRLKPRLLQHLDLLEFVGGTKAKLSKILINYAGLKNASVILYLFHKLFNKVTILKKIS